MTEFIEEAQPAHKETAGIESELRFPQVVAARIKPRGLDTLGIDIAQPIPVSELRAKGVVMVNALGEAERMIVQKAGRVDFTKKLFLTQQDLLQAKAAIIPEGVNEKQLRIISEDMGRFMDECRSAVTLNALLHPERTQVGADGYRNLIRTVRTKLDEEKRRSLLSRLSRSKKWLSIKREGELIREALEELRQRYRAPAAVRGIPVENISGRAEGEHLLGSKCPVLDCNHRFTDGMGIRIVDQDGLITGEKGVRVRLNEAVAHLALHGISNTGVPQDPDQRYVSIREYMPIFARRSEGSRVEIDVEEVQVEIGLAIVKRAMVETNVKADDNKLRGLVREYFFPSRL
jgi:hypothetical protein